MEQDEASYVLIGSDGRRQGPMPRHRVVELVERGFYGGEDRVEKDGGSSTALATHPDFAGFFIEGDSRFSKIQDARKERQARTQKYRRGKRFRYFFRFGIFAGLVVGIGLVVKEAERWLPSSVQTWVSQTVLGQGASENDGKDGGKQAVLAPLLDVLRLKYADESGKPAVAYDRGVEALVSGLEERRHEALADMERAVLFSDGDSWTIGGLIAALSYSDDPEAPRRIDSFVAHLNAVEDGEASLNLGLGVRALERDDLSEAAARASGCMDDTDYRPLCHWVMVAALGRSGQHQELGKILPSGLELFPESPEVLLWTADHLRSEGRYAEAEAILKSVSSDLETVVYFQRVRAAFEQEVGDFDAAIETLKTILQLRPGDRMASLELGVLLSQHRGTFSEAKEIFNALLEPGLEDFQADDLAFLHASHVQRELGDPEKALESANQAVERGAGGAPFHLARAMAMDAQGDLTGAEAVWDEMNLEGVEPRELARIHAWAAQLYLRTGRLRLARDQVDHGELADPNWPVLALLGAAVDLQIKDYRGLEARLTRALLSDLREDGSRVPTVQSWGVRVDGKKVADFLKQALSKEPLWGRKVPGFVGAVQLLDCQQSGECDEAKRTLYDAAGQVPDDPIVLLGVSHIAVQYQDWATALEAVERLKPMHSGRPVLLALEGAALAGLGRNREAIGLLEEGFRAEGSEATLAGRWLVEAHGNAGDWAAAEGVARRIRERDRHVFVTASFLRGRSLDSTK